MIKSDEHKFIFIHIPKTGGSSVAAALGPHLGLTVPQHEQLGWQNRLHNYMGLHHGFVWDEHLADYFSWTIVRNPFERLYSWYNAWSFDRENPRTDMHQLAVDIRFAEWVPLFFTEPRYTRYGAGQKPMTVCPHTGHSLKYIGRFEILQVSFDDVMRRIGLPQTALPIRNRYPHGSYEKHYDETAIQCVRDYWGEDLEEFGYDFMVDNAF